ncbi:hypothetical protein D3C76_1601700 [compost metagenome]
MKAPVACQQGALAILQSEPGLACQGQVGSGARLLQGTTLQVEAGADCNAFQSLAGTSGRTHRSQHIEAAAGAIARGIGVGDVL